MLVGALAAAVTYGIAHLIGEPRVRAGQQARYAPPRTTHAA